MGIIENDTAELMAAIGTRHGLRNPHVRFAVETTMRAVAYAGIECCVPEFEVVEHARDAAGDVAAFGSQSLPGLLRAIENVLAACTGGNMQPAFIAAHGAVSAAML